MSSRIQTLEDEIRTTYRGLIEQTTAALTENTASIRENNATIREMVAWCKKETVACVERG